MAAWQIDNNTSLTILFAQPINIRLGYGVQRHFQ
jgi:hypothetical protein